MVLQLFRLRHPGPTDQQDRLRSGAIRDDLKNPAVTGIACTFPMAIAVLFVLYVLMRYIHNYLVKPLSSTPMKEAATGPWANLTG
jgi:hypothetical protein